MAPRKRKIAPDLSNVIKIAPKKSRKGTIISRTCGAKACFGRAKSQKHPFFSQTLNTDSVIPMAIPQAAETPPILFARLNVGGEISDSAPRRILRRGDGINVRLCFGHPLVGYALEYSPTKLDAPDTWRMTLDTFTETRSLTEHQFDQRNFRTIGEQEQIKAILQRIFENSVGTSLPISIEIGAPKDDAVNVYFLQLEMELPARGPGGGERLISEETGISLSSQDLVRDQYGNPLQYLGVDRFNTSQYGDVVVVSNRIVNEVVQEERAENAKDRDDTKLPRAAFIAAHEIDHSLGLAHIVDVGEPTRFPVMDATAPSDEVIEDTTTMRELFFMQSPMSTKRIAFQNSPARRGDLGAGSQYQNSTFHLRRWVGGATTQSLVEEGLRPGNWDCHPDDLSCLSHARPLSAQDPVTTNLPIASSAIISNPEARGTEFHDVIIRLSASGCSCDAFVIDEIDMITLGELGQLSWARPQSFRMNVSAKSSENAAGHDLFIVGGEGERYFLPNADSPLSVQKVTNAGANEIATATTETQILEIPPSLNVTIFAGLDEERSARVSFLGRIGLSYALQGSEDLRRWTTLASGLEGAAISWSGAALGSLYFRVTATRTPEQE